MRREGRLVLFFTHGVSLRTWKEAGMLDREVALYKRLHARGVRSSFVTYGNSREVDFRKSLAGIRICSNRWRFGIDNYCRFLPLLHAPALAMADVFKTNQIHGSRAAVRAARLWRKPLIVRCGYLWSEFAIRDFGKDSVEARRALAEETMAFQAAHRVVVTTVAMKEQIAHRIPEVMEKTIVIPNYVDTVSFAPISGARQRKEIIYVGRLSEQKNVKALLKAIEPLDVSLTIIGRGEQEDRLKRRFGTMNGRISWRGNIAHKALPRALKRAGLFVLPSHYEGHPKTLIEAMACGLPVIGTQVPGIQELVRHGETGYLCGVSPEEIRSAIQALITDERLCSSLGHHARKFVEDHFALDRIVEAEIAMFNTLTGKSM